MIDRVVSTDEQERVHDLVRRAQQGDAAAFDALFACFAERVFRFVRSRVPPAEAEDITQRVFVQVIEALPRYEHRGLPFASWLFRIARNAVIDAARSRREHVSLDAALGSVSPGPGPAELAEGAADRIVLAGALASLPPDQRDVIAYRFFADLSTRDIAALMGKHEGTIRVLQFRAIRTLRSRLVPGLGPLCGRLDFKEAGS